ncbi:class I SAM-dependent methyltransferase [Streptomyces sp. NPDC056937]|uniref:class I SAM-dependent methyltransferase n=1 Tax=Streptomyces sp. NPDC056937 TaxID=3345969 RepID=UPI00363C2B4A
MATTPVPATDTEREPSVTQFDELARIYDDFSRLPFRRDLEFPSVFGLLGDLSRLKVLDLGCGSGVYSRALARSGTALVVGLDESGGMIDHARAQESAEPLGIRYLDGDLPAALEGGFDLVIGVYVLPYATTYQELVGLCRTAAGALRPGGRFVTLPIHPEAHHDPGHYERYGFRLRTGESPADGSPVELALSFAAHDIRVTARYWSVTTLEKALREAGFGPVRWQSHRLAPSAAGPPEFWAPYLSAPHAAILDTYKEYQPS